MPDLDDPRASLLGAGRTPTSSTAAREAQLFELERMTPGEVASDGTASWFVRAQNTAVVYTRTAAGAVLHGVCDEEFVAVFPDPSTRAVIRAGAACAVIEGEALAVIPPGPSEITMERGAEVVRLYSCRCDDVVAKCANADAYRVPDPNVKAYEPWPPPRSGRALRTYTPADAPHQPGRFGRIFRFSAVMVNYLPPEVGPRATDRLSPHHHEDFEQISIQLSGEYVHHLRVPWGPRLSDWRPDQALQAASPAVLVIPPPLVHTSRGVGAGNHQLVDVFGPPRADFSDAGWVLNPDDYPTPSTPGASP